MKMNSIYSYLSAVVAGTLLLAGCSDSTPPSAADSSTSTAVLKSVPEKDRIPGRYIVVLKDNVGSHVPEVASEMARRHGFATDFVYEHALKGFAGNIPEARLRDLLEDPRVDYIEPDQEMHTTAQTLDWGVSATGADSSSAVSGNGSGTVTGVRIYIIDTGIQTNHADLNVVGGINYAGGSSNQYTDGNGHGTHCAGIAAAKDNSSYTVGMAPGAPLYAVRVLNNNGSGTTSGVIAGVNWVRQQKQNNTSIPMVANMSLGGGASSTLDQAVNNCINAGVVMCVAAGNSGAVAGNYSPARVANAITVGAHGSNQVIASWSNYGSVVDILAPGVSIRSTYRNSSTAIMSGTSMACPHVAGAAALYLSNANNAGSTPAQVATALINDSQSWINVNGRANTTTNTLRVNNY